MKGKVRRIKEAFEAIRAAETDADKLLRELLPKGTKIAYRHGPYWRRATVILHAYTTARGSGLKVKGPFSAGYWIDASRVEQVIE